MMQEEKSKKNVTVGKIKTLFNKIKNFNQLKEEVFEMKNSFQKTIEDVNIIKNDYSSINKKAQNIDKYFEGMNIENFEEDVEFRSIMKEKIDDYDKKFNFLLGDFDINKNNNDNFSDYNGNENNKNQKQRKNKIINFIDINKKLNHYQQSKVNNSDFESKNLEYQKSLNKLEKKLNDILSILYGNNNDDMNNKEEYISNNNFLFTTKNELEKYKTKTDKEIDKIWEKINELDKQYEFLFNKIKDNCTLNDLDQVQNLILEKTEELFINLNNKNKNKEKDDLAIKNLQKNFKKLLELLAEKEEKEQKWLITKRPLGGYTCGSCESYLGDLNSYTDRQVHWKKLPVKIKEINKGNETFKIGNGHSRLLNMINFDKNGKPTLNPFDNINDSNNSSSNLNENNKSKDKDDLNKSGNNPVIHSTISNYFKKEKKEINSKTRNKFDKNEKKFPSIMISNSVEPLDKLKKKLNSSMSSFNFFTARIRKNKMKKLYKFDE